MTLFTEKELAAYYDIHQVHVPWKKFDTDGTGLKDAGEPSSIEHIMHTRGIGVVSAIQSYESSAMYAKMFPVIDGIDPAVRENIALNFYGMANLIGGHARNKTLPSVTKEEVSEKLAAFYNILKPNTENNRYFRQVIEAAFKVLELGPIPQMKYTELLGTGAKSFFGLS